MCYVTSEKKMLVYLVVGFVSVPFFSLFAFNNFETKNKKAKATKIAVFV